MDINNLKPICTGCVWLRMEYMGIDYKVECYCQRIYEESKKKEFPFCCGWIIIDESKAREYYEI